MSDLTAVSLFAGIGGFELALGNHGVKVVASVEIDDAARGVLKHRFPDTKLFTDVQQVTGDDLIAAGFVPERGIITGGFPCQDLSVAGRRAGLAGARSGLYWEIVRLAEETKAKWLVLENVPGLLTSQKGRDMGIVLGTLVDCGYSVSWRVLDAQFFGVAQRRRRVFIVAGRTSEQRVGQILLESEGSRRNFEAGEPQGEVATRAITESTGVNSEPVLMRGREGKPGGGKGPLLSYNKSLTIATANDQVLFDVVSETYPIHDKATRFNGKRKLHDGSYSLDGAGNGLGIGEDGAPMNTLTSGDRHAVGTESNVRRLTPVECERLQGFPDDWTKERYDYKKQQVVEQADSSRYKQCGNAVAVPVVDWIIGRLVEADADD